MTAFDEEGLARLIRSLPPAPAAWVRAAQELPLARTELDEIVSRAEEDAAFRVRLVADLVAAAAAGLLAKVARASSGDWAEARGIAAQAESLRDRAAPLAQLDADQYEAALMARGNSGEQRGDRRDFALGRA